MSDDSPMIPTAERSLMVVSKEQEHCVLYDGNDLPSLLEHLLTMGCPPPSNLEEAANLDEESLTQDHFRAIIRELLSRKHASLV